jgi:diguanylate cyclase (GGDEF)-like protein
MLLRFEELKQAGGLCSSVAIGIAILQASKSAACGLDSLTQIAERDPASALRLIQAANQARSYGSERIVSVKLAALELGTARTREELLRFNLASPNRPGYCSAFDYEEFWSWSIACAHASRQLADHVPALDPDGAYVLGLASHCGELGLATAHSERYRNLLQTKPLPEGSELCRIEQEQFQISRWEIGALLLAEAGLPVAYRHSLLERVRPDQSPATSAERALSDVLAAAEAIADMIVGPRCNGAPDMDAWRRLVRHGAHLTLSEMRLHTVVESVRRSWSEATLLLQEEYGEGGIIGPELGMLLNSATAIRPRALVVDADPAVLRLTQDTLTEAGYEVMIAMNGLEALRVLERVHPEIVIADSNAPGISGSQLCSQMRRQEYGLRSYLIMLTDSDSEEQHVESFRSGADDCLHKPVSPRVLLARVQAGRRLVELQKQVEHDKQERLRQISELSLLTRRLESSSTVDDLTGLPNRRYALSRLEEEWRAAERLCTPLSVIMVDVDHFKRINDVLGHSQGDSVLQEIGMTMLARVRRADVICRMGGEEFLVINVDSDLAGAMQCAERLRNSVERHRIPGGDPQSTITISLGVATRIPTMSSCAELLKAADAALYEAKAAGRNAVRGPLKL